MEVGLEEHPLLAKLPDKPFFKIGEVARLVGLKQYILRYWESEFRSLEPRKSPTGHRQYSREDVALILCIKTLLYDEMFTIQGARQRLQEMSRKGMIDLRFDEDDDGGVDPLAGTDRVMLEQKIKLLEVHLQQANEAHDRALEAAQLSNDALREVEEAHLKTLEEKEALEKKLGKLDEAHQEELMSLETRLAEARVQTAALEQERDDLREALTKAKEAGEEAVKVVEVPAPAPAVDEARDSATKAALLEAEQESRELRSKLRYHLTDRQRLLKEVRTFAHDLANLVHAPEKS